MSDELSEYLGEWRMRAACKGLEWTPFFPNRGESTKEAKSVCDTCPVTVECLEDAVVRKEPAGVRGGLSTRERRKEIQKRRKKAS